jgi:triosephosphate isomerase
MELTNQQPFIAGNWKMHKTIAEALDLVKSLGEQSSELEGVQLVVIPPFTSLSEVRKEIEGTPIRLGAQNLFWEEKGAYTGEISPLMLKDAGCQYVVVGHSERRQYFGETDDSVNRKIKAVLAHEMVPIVCIGETIEERKKEETIKKVGTQITEGLKELSEEEISRIIIAYEPIWAIGTGETATPSQAEEVHNFIREKLGESYGKEIASCAIILYGGSVKPANTFELLIEKDINGALVGGASLEADSFIQIAKEAIRGYKGKK